MSSASDTVSQIAAAQAEILKLGQTSQSVAGQTKAAFTSIGAMAKSQLQDIAVGALTQFEDALLKAFETHKFSAKALGAALKEMLSETLKSIGQEATVKAAFEIAEGVAALAGIATAGLASGHFAAASAYLGVALTAGAAAGAMSHSGAAATAPKGAETGGSGGGSVRQQVTVVGVLDTAGAEALHDQMNQAAGKRDLA